MLLQHVYGVKTEQEQKHGGRDPAGAKELNTNSWTSDGSTRTQQTITTGANDSRTTRLSPSRGTRRSHRRDRPGKGLEKNSENVKKYIQKKIQINN